MKKKKGVFGKLADFIILGIVLLLLLLNFFGPKIGLLNKAAKAANWISDKYMPKEPQNPSLSGNINTDSKLQTQYASIHREMSLTLNADNFKNGKGCFMKRLSEKDLGWDSSKQSIFFVSANGGTEVYISNTETGDNAEKRVSTDLLIGSIPCVIAGKNKEASAFCTKVLGKSCRGQDENGGMYLEVDKIEITKDKKLTYYKGSEKVDGLGLGFGILLYAVDNNHRCFVTSEGNGFNFLNPKCNGGEKGLKEKCNEVISLMLIDDANICQIG